MLHILKQEDREILRESQIQFGNKTETFTHMIYFQMMGAALELISFMGLVITEPRITRSGTAFEIEVHAPSKEHDKFGHACHLLVRSKSESSFVMRQCYKLRLQLYCIWIRLIR